MRKFFVFFTSIVFFTVPLTFSTNLNADDARSARTIVGQVTVLYPSTLIIKEDSTGVEYELNASPDKLKEVRTGYRAEVKTDNGKISSLTLLGMPMRAEPAPFQKWKVIKYPQG